MFEKTHVEEKSFDSDFSNGYKNFPKGSSKGVNKTHSLHCIFWCYSTYPDCKFETNSQRKFRKHLRNFHAV